MTKPDVKPRQIDIVTKYFLPVKAGIEISIFNTSKQLIDRGWCVNIHTTPDTLTTRGVFPNQEELAGLHIHRGSFNFMRFLTQIPYEHSDVVSLHNFNLLAVIYFSAIIPYLKLIKQKNFILEITPHGGFTPAWSLFSQPTRGLKILFHKTIGVWFMQTQVDVVRAVSPWEAEQIQAMGVEPQKTHVIGNGIEVEAFGEVEQQAQLEVKNRVAKFGKYLIVIGRIDPVKNLDTTIRALSLLPADIKLVIVGQVGQQTYYQLLLELIKELNLEKRVIFYGEVSGFDKYYLLKKAEMLIHMSIYESFCIVVKEAMSQGLPCIVADNSALKALVKPPLNGYHVATYDWQQLAAVIKDLLADSSQRAQISHQNILETAHETWSTIGGQLHALYSLSKMNHLETKPAKALL